MATWICSVEVDKVGGITVKVQDADNKVEQTLVMDGTKIELTVKSDSATSVISQTAEKVTVHCKQFEVIATETMDLKSSKACSISSSDSLTVKAAKAMSLSSDDKVGVAAQQSLSLCGNTGVTVASPQKIALAGQAQLTFEGAMIEGKAKGMLSLESSGVATFKGSLTNVQGTLVNLG